MAQLSNYIIAGTQPWTRDVFARVQQTCPGEWCHAWTPVELDAVVTPAPRWIFVLHWHWWIPSRIWQHIDTVNFHLAPLPWGRGGNTIEHQLMLGKTESTLTAHRVCGELDGGDIYGTRGPISLAGSKPDILSRCIDPTVDLIRWIIEVEPEPVPQQGTPVIFKRLPRAEYEAFWRARA